MATIRQWHNYLGMLIAPSVLFFALTGTVQIFGLHEAHGTYTPFPIVEKLGRLHKDQVFELAEHHEKPAMAPGARLPPPADDTDDAARLPIYLLKWVFTLVALGLIASTCLGIWIGLSHPRNRRLNACLLAAGVALPAVIVLL